MGTVKQVSILKYTVGASTFNVVVGFESCSGTVKQLSILKYTAGASTFNVVGSNPALGLTNNCQF